MSSASSQNDFPFCTDSAALRRPAINELYKWIRNGKDAKDKII